MAAVVTRETRRYVHLSGQQFQLRSYKQLAHRLSRRRTRYEIKCNLPKIEGITHSRRIWDVPFPKEETPILTGGILFTSTRGYSDRGSRKN